MSTGPETLPCPFDPDDRVAFAYGELDAEQAPAFQAHLEGCPDCQAQVAQLQAFAGLTRRITGQAEPQLAWELPAPSLARRRSAWSGWLLWSGATAAVAAGVLLLLLMLPGPPAQEPSSTQTPAVTPRAPAVAQADPPATPAVAPQPARVQRVAVQGSLQLRPAAGGPARQASGQVELNIGDRLATPGDQQAAFEAADGTRLALSGASAVALVETADGPSGERWRLERGELVCQVAPREAKRPFAVEAGPGQVVVKGTRFALRLEKVDTLVVTVSEGVVAVGPRGDGARTTDVQAGQQARLVSGQAVQIDTPDSRARELLGLAPEPPARRQAAKAPVSRPTQVAITQPKPAPAVEPTKATAPAPVPSGPGLNADGLAAELAADTNWVFDGIRRDMRAGKYADGLRKLDNYLGDPLGPARDEATYLKALCQEQLGRIQAAQRSYSLYLERWPSGPRAQAAQTGRARTR